MRCVYTCQFGMGIKDSTYGAFVVVVGALASGEDGGETAPLALCEAVEARTRRFLLKRCVKPRFKGVNRLKTAGNEAKSSISGRYSRLGSCWEAAEMLAQASCWRGGL